VNRENDGIYEVMLKVTLSTYNKDRAGDRALEYIWGQEVFADDPHFDAAVVSVAVVKKAKP
jgi:hypothetical protein